MYFLSRSLNKDISVIKINLYLLFFKFMVTESYLIKEQSPSFFTHITYILIRNENIVTEKSLIKRYFAWIRNQNIHISKKNSKQKKLIEAYHDFYIKN